MFVPNNTRAYMDSRQENRQASKQASDHPSEVKQARAKLIYNTRCITLGVVTARSTAKRMCRNMRMNAILPFTAQPCSCGNYARMELVVKYWR